MSEYEQTPEECSHDDLVYTGDTKEVANDEVHEIFRCASCGATVHKVFEHTYNRVKYADGETEEVDR